MKAVMHQLAPLMDHHEFGQLVVDHTQSPLRNMLISQVDEYHLDKRLMYVPRSKARLVIWGRLPVMLSVMQVYRDTVDNSTTVGMRTTKAKKDYLRNYSQAKTFSRTRRGRAHR